MKNPGREYMDISALKNPYYGNDISTKFVEMPHLFPQGFIIFSLFNIRWFFNGFIEKLRSGISSFLTGMAFSYLFVWRNDDLVPQSIIFSLGQRKYHFFTQKDVEMPHLFKLKLEFVLFYFSNELDIIWI